MNNGPSPNDRSRLQSLTIENLRGSTSPFTFKFDADKRMVIIYGENGTGKSTICDAFDLLSNGGIASLDNCGLGKATYKYWKSVGKSGSDIAVALTTSDATYKAMVSKNDVAWIPANRKPHAEVLRRTHILSLITETPGKRYEAISRFINVSGIETSETALDQLMKQVDAEQNRHAERLTENQRQLDNLAKDAGVTDENPVDWARRQAARDFSNWDREEIQLRKLESAFQRLSSHEGTFKEVSTRVTAAQARIDESIKIRDAALIGISDSTGDVIDILDAASRFLSKTPSPNSCPLCESESRVDDLSSRVSDRIKEFKTLKKYREDVDAANQNYERIKSEPERMYEKYLQDRTAFSAQLDAFVWSSDVLLPKAICPEDIAQFDQWYRAQATLLDSWKNIGNARAAEKKNADNLRTLISNYDEALEIPADNQKLLQAMTQTLKILREERRKFTDGVLSSIAEDVGELYDKVHPGEGREKVSLQLDEKKRASLEIGVAFEGRSDLPPQAYFSESHLDTLGLCVFLALAKREDPSSTILVIDDVLTSVDDSHMNRVVDMLYEQSAYFRHCIITTHYKPWKLKFQWGRLRHEGCRFVELGTWSITQGMSLLNQDPKSEIQILETNLKTVPFDAQIVAGKAGVVLEAVLDFLTRLYECAVPRKDEDRLTIGDMMSAVSPKLRNAMRVEKLTDKESGRYEMIPLGDIINKISKLAGARNDYGAHYKEGTFGLGDADAREFGTCVLELADLIIDREYGWPTDRSSGSYHATKKETRRLHPFVRPS